MGASTPYPDGNMAQNFQHPSPQGRLKVKDRWQTEYRYQYVASVPKPHRTAQHLSATDTAQIMKTQQTRGATQPVVPHTHAPHLESANPAQNETMHHHLANQSSVVTQDPGWDTEVAEAEAVAKAAAAAADRAAAAADEAAMAAAEMRNRKIGSPRRQPATPSSAAPANSMPMQQHPREYQAAAYMPTPPRPMPEPVPDAGFEGPMEGFQDRQVLMLPANHVCREHTVHTTKDPNPQAFLQAECQKRSMTPAEEPALFVPFEPRTRVERNPKFYKFMPHELLHYVPPAGKPINRDYPAAMCLDMFD